MSAVYKDYAIDVSIFVDKNTRQYRGEIQFRKTVYDKWGHKSVDAKFDVRNINESTLVQAIDRAIVIMNRKRPRMTANDRKFNAYDRRCAFNGAI